MRSPSIEFKLNSNSSCLEILPEEKLDDDTIELIGKKIKDLESLAIPNNNINKTNFHYITDYLKDNKTLRYLNLSGNRIGDESLRYLFEKIEYTEIKYIDLSFNMISDKGARAIESLVFRKKKQN